MRDMRKYHHGFAVWGGKAPNAVNAMRHGVPVSYQQGSFKTTAIPCTYYVDGCKSASKAFVSGMTSIDLFPTTGDIMQRIGKGGVRSDWQRIAEDLRRALDAWAAETGAHRREREGA